MNPAGSTRCGSFRLRFAHPKVTPSLRSNSTTQCAVRASNLFHRVSSLRRGLDASHPSAPKEPTRLMELGLPLFVCMRFQNLFHSPSGVLFAFPSRYWFTIGRLRVFSLGGWSPHLQTGFHVSRPTCRKPSSTDALSCTGLSPTAATLSRAFH